MVISKEQHMITALSVIGSTIPLAKDNTRLAIDLIRRQFVALSIRTCSLYLFSYFVQKL